MNFKSSDNLRDQIAAKFGEGVFSEPFGSALNSNLHGVPGEWQFDEILLHVQKRVHGGFLDCVEIGTCCGISTVKLLFSNVAKHVFTFDILDTKIRHDIWKEFSVEECISSFLLKNSEEIRAAISKLDFDLVYIDGSHVYNDVVYDIETVEKCGRIIFHDYDLYSKNDVMKAVHDLIYRRGGRFFAIPPFAYWEATP
jgi:hypothetical protein